MTLIAQSTTKTIEQEDDDEVRTIMTALPVILTVDEMKRLSPWMQDIERIARELVRSVPEESLERRHPLAIAAAAVFESHLSFRGSTSVKVAVHRLELIAGVTNSMIRGAWFRFFKKSVDLRKHRLDMMTVDDSMNLSDMIHAAIALLRKGVELMTPAITGWFTRVENLALQLARNLTLPEDIYREVAALSAIYEASYLLLGPRLVNITFRDAGEVCGMSGALVSRSKNILFPANGG